MANGFRACVFLAVLTIHFSIPSASAWAEDAMVGVTLRQCYDLALARSESLKSRHQDIVQSNARARAALSGALPSFDYQFNDTWQDPKGVDQLNATGFGGFAEKNEVDAKFSARQTLFSGTRINSAYSGFKRESARDELLLQRAALELFEKTANTFYVILERESERNNTRTAWTLAEDQVKELKGFLRLGKSRPSEVYAAEAHSAALKARIDQIDAQILAAREDLFFLTGQDFSKEPLADEISDSPSYGTLQDALRAAKGRTDLRAQQQEIDARRFQIRYEKGAYWPEADITGDYYTRRATYLDAIDWDVILSLRVPFYQGGSVAARVRESEAVYQQAVLKLEEMQRAVASDVRKIYGQLTDALRESQSFADAARAARQSYESQRKEYRLGLVTNLDVLQALDLLQQQKNESDAARHKVKLLYLQLQIAQEHLP